MQIYTFEVICVLNNELILSSLYLDRKRWMVAQQRQDKLAEHQLKCSRIGDREKEE